jgi:hypothetical protein
MSRVVWSAPDGSWGACEEHELIVIPEEDLGPLTIGDIHENVLRDYLVWLSGLVQ